MSDDRHPPLPKGRPRCKHGRGVGGMHGCQDCYKEGVAINKAVQPLVDEWWTERGNRDLNHLMSRAYHMGMKHAEGED